MRASILVFFCVYCVLLTTVVLANHHHGGGGGGGGGGGHGKGEDKGRGRSGGDLGMDKNRDRRLCDEKYRKFGSDHTMCQFHSNQCKDKKLLGNLVPAKKKILGYHNHLRQKVATGEQKGQPKAANMRELRWDNELALVAQRWAEQCAFGHDKNHQIDRFNKTSGYVGQNVAKYSKSDENPKVNYRKLIDGWYNECKFFSPSKLKPYAHADAYGHYSQLMWAKTDLLGCGHSYFRSERSGNIWFEHYLVCNYARAGNIIGAEMYERGEPASKCEGTRKSKYKGLCG